MKRLGFFASLLLGLCLQGGAQAQTTKPIYVSLPGRDAYPPPLSAEGLYKRAELEFTILKEKPNFKAEQFMDDRFYKTALKLLTKVPGAKS